MKVATQLATTAAPRLVEKVCPLRVVLAFAASAKGLKRPAGEARDTQQRAQTLW